MGIRRSSISTEIPAAPSSPRTASKFMRFKGGRIGRPVQPSKWNGDGEWTTTNAGGRSSGYAGVGRSAK